MNMESGGIGIHAHDNGQARVPRRVVRQRTLTMKCKSSSFHKILVPLEARVSVCMIEG